MASEIAKVQDAHKVVKVESQPAHVLQKEASVDLSSRQPKKVDETAKSHVEVKAGKATGEKPESTKPDTSKSDTSKPATNSLETKKVEAVKPELAKIETAKSDTKHNDKAKPVAQASIGDKTESASLTPELKSAVDKAGKVIVKMQPAHGENSDIYIKADGKIQHNLNMDPKRADNKDLTIAFEQKDTKGLSVEQTASLQKLMEYVKVKNKEVSVDTPDSAAKAAVAKEEKQKTEENQKAEAKIAPKPQEREEEVSAKPAPRAEQSTGENSSRATSTGSYEQSTQANSDNSSSNRSENYAAPEVRQVKMSDVLTEWFTADPEKFKKLFPELYKLICGADGKIDPSKLQQLEESNDPMLASVKEKLGGLVNEFPPTKALSGGVASLSSDAVNKTGALLADKASQVSNELGTAGYCAKGVSFAIERATGKSIAGNANDMRDALPANGFTEASSKDLKVGQVVHVYWTPEVYAEERAKRGNCPNYGDIAVIGKGKDGQLYAFNDHATPLNEYLQKSRYDWNSLKAFTPPATA